MLSSLVLKFIVAVIICVLLGVIAGYVISKGKMGYWEAMIILACANAVGLTIAGLLGIGSISSLVVLFVMVLAIEAITAYVILIFLNFRDRKEIG